MDSPKAAPRSLPRATAGAAASAQRIAWLLIASTAAVVLVLAWALQPDPSGMGTHEQLGLPPCGFLYMTTLPCPGCGLTTSFAHMARLQITSAASAHPLGIPLFMLTCVAIPFAIVACVRGVPVVTTIERMRVSQGLLLLSAAALVAWLARLLSIVVA
ncbi:MAG: DUF2752 domain-containing protein [Myxococcales bacterium]|nr:DUF2752 domain-containing protein [Myxococcales bacterium]